MSYLCNYELKRIEMNPKVYHLSASESICSVLNSDFKYVLLDDAYHSEYSQPPNEALIKIFKLDSEDEIRNILIITGVSIYSFSGFIELAEKISNGELAIRKICYYGLNQKEIMWESAITYGYNAFAKKLKTKKSDNLESESNPDRGKRRFYELTFDTNIY